MAWNPALRANPPPRENPDAGWPTLDVRREQELPAVDAPPLSMTWVSMTKGATGPDEAVAPAHKPPTSSTVLQTRARHDSFTPAPPVAPQSADYSTGPWLRQVPPSGRAGTCDNSPESMRNHG